MTQHRLPPTGNLFADIPAELPEEWFERILKRGGIEIERIVSRGHATAPGEWYDQDGDEWVLVLQGQARLHYQESWIDLSAGDYLWIPAHTRHRVESTSAEPETIWLAIHFRA